MSEYFRQMMHMQMRERCVNCGCSKGAHSGGDTLVALGANQCPQHEGRMDWPSPPSYFVPSGDYDPVEYNTPARRMEVGS